MTKICSRCVMDSSDTGIEFDRHGNCSHCSNYLTKVQLKSILKTLQKMNTTISLKQILIKMII